MNGSEGFVRMRTLQAVVLLVFALILGRLAYIQLVDSRYDELARGNVLRPEVQYPPRGEVYDRNGEYLVQSRECYDLMVIYHDLDRGGFDTARRGWWPTTFPRRRSSGSTSAISAVSIRSTAPCATTPARSEATCWAMWGR